MQSNGFRFSRQEERVLSLSLSGLSDKDIADRMGVGLGTIRTFWKRIRSKAGGSSRAEVLQTLARAESGEATGIDADVRFMVEAARRQAVETQRDWLLEGLRQLANLRADSLFFLHKDGVPTLFSDRLAWSIEDSFGDKASLWGAAAPESVVTVAKLWSMAETGEVAEGSVKLREKNGQLQTYNLRIGPFASPQLGIDWIGLITLDGSAHTAVGVSRAATDIRAEAFARARVGLCVTAIDGTVETANERFAELLGYQPSAIVGQKLPNLVTFSDRKRYDALVARCDAEGDAQAGLSMIPSNGGLVPVLMDLSTFHRDGAVVYRVVTLRRTADTSRRF